VVPFGEEEAGVDGTLKGEEDQLEAGEGGDGVGEDGTWSVVEDVGGVEAHVEDKEGEDGLHAQEIVGVGRGRYFDAAGVAIDLREPDTTAAEKEEHVPLQEDLKDEIIEYQVDTGQTQ
jgi:hypothetical protein